MTAVSILFEDLIGSPNGETVGKTTSPVNFRAQDEVVLTAHGMAGDAYEGAERQSREMAMWRPNNRSADSEIIPSKGTADARLKDTVRNDAFVASGVRLQQDSIVGSMYMLNSKPATKVLLGKEDEAFEEEFQQEVEEKFTLGVESTENWIDSSRRMTFTDMVRQAVGSHSVLGEYLYVADWNRDESRPFKMSMRAIDIDRLSTPFNQQHNAFVVGGVQMNNNHVPTGYYIRKAHPSDYLRSEVNEWEFKEARLPWGRAQVLHGFEQTRANQTRGISSMTAALKEMRQTKTFRETVLQNAVVQATYAATIESDMDTNGIFERLGGGNLGEEGLAGVVEDYMGSYMGAVQKFVGDRKQFQLGGVRIPHLPPGSKLQMRPAGQGGPLGTEFEQSLLRYIAATLGVSYEQLSKDYSSTNYSSARAAMSETWKFMQASKRSVADRFATTVFRLWLEEMLNAGMIESLPKKFRNRGDMSWLYTGLNMDAIARCEWVGASRGQIDELKETQAAVLRLKYNLSTLEDEHGRLGKDYRSSLKQTAREKAIQDKLGITVEESSNMMNAASGAPREKESKGEKNDSSGKPKGTLANGTLENDFLDAEHLDVDARGNVDA